MRTRTNFIVEYKTSRRQTKARPTSIWGNLDLQAVARQVEADNDLPANVPAVTASPLEAARVSGSREAVLDARSEIADQPATTIDVSQAADHEPISTETSGLPVAPLSLEPATRRPANKASSKSSPRKGRGQAPNHPAALDRRDRPLQAAYPDELAALEAENRHLKRLMIVRLRAENSRLKSMLSRFGDA